MREHPGLNGVHTIHVSMKPSELCTSLVCVACHQYVPLSDDACAVSTGDWFKVEKLIKETGGDDVALVNAWNKIGQYYSDRQKWAKAAQYYTQVS